MTTPPRDYQAGTPGDASLVEADGRWTLVLVRDVPHPIDRVWEALTDPAELREWAPFDPNRNLATPGGMTLTMPAGAAGDAPEAAPGEVREAVRPTVLEYTWQGDVLRWELSPIPGGTRLILRHTVQERRWGSIVAAGWHICLDVATHAMAGAPVGRIIGHDAMAVGWERLRDAYARQLGVPEGEAPPLT